jgi:hypothetical protein
MKELVAKIGHFCENHVEKIVLVLASAVCIWLFFTRVIFSPDVVSLQGKNYAPGQIDKYVYEQKAQELSAEMQRGRSGNAKVYKTRLTGAIDPCDPVIAGVIKRPLPKGFVGLFESPLSFIDATVIPKSGPATAAGRYAGASRKYRLPMIPDVTDVAVSRIRAAAYVPVRAVSAQTAYDSGASEPNDIDLVTVEARFNTVALYRAFQASFNGEDVQKEEWRDPCLADPTFAAVQLQRQELREDGSWSDWKALPRSRVDNNRDLLTVVERVEDLPPGGVDVRRMQFGRKPITLSVLQPDSYQIASAEEDWFPPSFYGKFKDLQKKVEAEERKEQKEQERGQDDRTNMGRDGGGGRAGANQMNMGRGGRAGTTGRAGAGNDMQMGGRGGRGGRGGQQTGDPMMTGGNRGRGGRGGRGGADEGYGDMYGMPGMGPDGKRKASTDEVYFDFREEMLNFRSDLSKSEKAVLIWAFDDTAEPGKTYQYRLRLGVFNPVVGTGQLVDRDMDKNNQVILWSPFSSVTDPVAVPRMVYLFAKNVVDKTKTATVEVARYKLGYWRTEDFQVRPGESIGKEVEPKDPEKERNRDRERDRRMAMMTQAGGRISDPRGDMMTDPMYAMPNPLDASQPKVVDYDTGAVLVDLVETNDWGDAPNLRPRMYYDMLYTSDGTVIEHMPVSMGNWPKEVSAAYQVVQSEKRREPKPFRSFSKSSRNRGMDPYGGGMYDMGGGGGMGPYGR